MACVRCNNAAAETREYIVTKPTGDVRRVMDEKCAELTAETYPVKAAGRQPAKAQPEEAKPQAAPASTSAKKEEG